VTRLPTGSVRGERYELTALGLSVKDTVLANGSPIARLLKTVKSPKHLCNHRIGVWRHDRRTLQGRLQRSSSLKPNCTTQPHHNHNRFSKHQPSRLTTCSSYKQAATVLHKDQPVSHPKPNQRFFWCSGDGRGSTEATCIRKCCWGSCWCWVWQRQQVCLSGAIFVSRLDWVAVSILGLNACW